VPVTGHFAASIIAGQQPSALAEVLVVIEQPPSFLSPTVPGATVAEVLVVEQQPSFLSLMVPGATVAEVLVVEQQPSFFSPTAPGATVAVFFMQHSVSLFAQVLASPLHFASHFLASVQQADFSPIAPAEVFCFSVESQAAKNMVAQRPAVTSANFLAFIVNAPIMDDPIVPGTESGPAGFLSIRRPNARILIEFHTCRRNLRNLLTCQTRGICPPADQWRHELTEFGGFLKKPVPFRGSRACTS